jgi:DNA-binding MarR family transcriptional regulator
LGITPDQFTVLRWLSEAGCRGLTQTEITERMASDPNTITATVRRMEAARLLERVPHESDGRSKRVLVLPNGLEVFNEAHALALTLQGRVLDCLTEAEANMFLMLLERVAEACSQEGSLGARKKD